MFLIQILVKWKNIHMFIQLDFQFQLLQRSVHSDTFIIALERVLSLLIWHFSASTVEKQELQFKPGLGKRRSKVKAKPSW